MYSWLNFQLDVLAQIEIVKVMYLISTKVSMASNKLDVQLDVTRIYDLHAVVMRMRMWMIQLMMALIMLITQKQIALQMEHKMGQMLVDSTSLSCGGGEVASLTSADAANKLKTSGDTCNGVPKAKRSDFDDFENGSGDGNAELHRNAHQTESQYLDSTE